MRLLRKIPVLSGEISAGGGVASGVYQGSGGLYFTVGEVGYHNAVQVTPNAQSDNWFVSGQVRHLRWWDNSEDSNVRPNQVRVEIHEEDILSALTQEIGSGTNLSGLAMLVDTDSER